MVIVVIVETAVIPAGSHQRAALMYTAISCVYICTCNCICICICTVQFSKGSCIQLHVGDSFSSSEVYYAVHWQNMFMWTFMRIH